MKNKNCEIGKEELILDFQNDNTNTLLYKVVNNLIWLKTGKYFTKEMQQELINQLKDSDLLNSKVNGVEYPDGKIAIEFDSHFYANENTGNGKRLISSSNFENSELGAETGYVKEDGTPINDAVETMIESALQIESVRTTKQNILNVVSKDNVFIEQAKSNLANFCFENSSERLLVIDFFNEFEKSIGKEKASNVIKRLLDRVTKLETNKMEYNETYFGKTKAGQHLVFSRAITKENESLDFTWDILNEMKQKIDKLTLKNDELTKLIKGNKKYAKKV